jgi:flagellar basal body rod protein FlgB
MNQLRAEYAGQNIARANLPGAQAVRLDFGVSQSLLSQAANVHGNGDRTLFEAMSVAADSAQHGERMDAAGTPIQLDEEVADMAAANLNYQALSESLSRHFGLMRLAVTGKN